MNAPRSAFRSIRLDASKKEALLDAFRAVNHRLDDMIVHPSEFYTAEGRELADGEHIVFHSPHGNLGYHEICHILQDHGIAVEFEDLCNADDASQFVCDNPYTTDTVWITNPSNIHFILA